MVDEIGKMELFSRSFVDAVQRLFESSREKEERVVLVTVPLARGGKSHRLLEQLRLRTDCRLFQVPCPSQHWQRDLCVCVCVRVRVCVVCVCVCGNYYTHIVTPVCYGI